MVNSFLISIGLAFAVCSCQFMTCAASTQTKYQEITDSAQFWLEKLRSKEVFDDFPTADKNANDWTSFCVYNNINQVIQRERPETDQASAQISDYLMLSGEYWPYLLDMLLASGDLPVSSMEMCRSLALQLCENITDTGLSADDLRALFKDINRVGAYTDKGFDLQESNLRQLLVLGYLYLAPPGELACDRAVQLYVQGMGNIVCYFAWNWPLPIAGPACRRFINLVMLDLYGSRDEIFDAVQSYQEPSRAFLAEWVKRQSHSSGLMYTELLSIYSAIMSPLLGKTWLDCMLTTSLNFRSTEKLLAFFFLNRFSQTNTECSIFQIINNTLHLYVLVRAAEQAKLIDRTHPHRQDLIEECINIMQNYGFIAPSQAKPGTICFDSKVFYQSLHEVTRIMCPESIEVATFAPFELECAPLHNWWLILCSIFNVTNFKPSLYTIGAN